MRTKIRILHHDPPLTPHAVMFRYPSLIWFVVGTSLTLAILARIDGGSVLRIFDEPIQEWTEARRTESWGEFFRILSRLGSNLVVFSAFAVLCAVTARRCKMLAFSLALAVLARPPLEWVIKELVDRERPDLTRLVPGTGPSHPSGHVLAAVALWGLLPPLVALITNRKWLWWLTSFISGVLIAGIALSRIYLGVHWFSDIVQGLLLGWLYLTGLEVLFNYHHRGRECHMTAKREEVPDDDRARELSSAAGG